MAFGDDSAQRSEPQLSDNAVTVLKRRYLIKDEQGQPVEEPGDLFWRVARNIAQADARYGASPGAVEALAETFFGVMASRVWMPNSPTLMNAGRPLGQLSACFVLPVDDALSNGATGIYDTLRNMALVHQSGGGTGFSFSQLRPKNDVVRSTMGVASGPVSFMSLYDASTEVVKQGGTRRGANMGILRVDHPDILDFITCKNDITKVTNFNISVGVTDAFMQAVEAGWPYDLVHPRSGEVVGQLDAREVFQSIVHGAWKTGEPGVFFIDRANHYNPVPHLGSYEATNPCGEQPLLPYDVCNLGSVNVGAFVHDGEVDWDGLRRTVHLCTHFLDNVIDVNRYPLPEITDLANRIRRIGLGIMGWADFLVRLGIPYSSDDAIEWAHRMMQFVDEEAKVESERLAESRGVFPEWERSIWGPDASCARDAEGNRIRPMRRLRNCNLTTVAPTGTISIIAGCSSGIEPLFAVAFMRNQAGVLMPDVNQDFVALARQEGWYSEDLIRRIAEEGHIHFPEVPERSQAVFVTAHDVSPEWHIRMQAAFQECTDSAISKTCNFPNESTEDYVREIYEMAYRVGCKGVTVYRDGSRDLQVLSTGKTAKEVQDAHGSERDGRDTEVVDLKAQVAELEAELGLTRKRMHEVEAENLQRRQKRSRPELLRGTTRRLETPLGTLYVTITEDDRSQPFEMFMSLGKAGGALMADVEAMGRLISLALRSGIPLQEIYRQLRGISSDRVSGLGPNKVLSVPDAIGIAIEKWMQEKQGVQQDLLEEVTIPGAVATPPKSSPSPSDGTLFAFKLDADQHAGACPDCGSQLEFAEGCMKCHVCGFSECG
ncbi:MAG: vitamin B12-dependent ribonucleotide reductase [Gemmatimonadota bacterium]|nr:vitamin B12-dependent ribonucleotide reductase [Gemmatimonadota bacterium]MDH3477285.1 vitamin B12-dependent ribonucleotide reductase [Gemmatimonadota bacterium]MDH5548659.1 vitamin B12-dependent ribonucleotide reductase [Gemmatimonadota bacterium]